MYCKVKPLTVTLCNNLSEILVAFGYIEAVHWTKLIQFHLYSLAVCCEIKVKS